MSLPPPPADLLALLQTRASFVLAVHKGPDGDAAGSALGLYHALQAAGKQVQVVAPTPVPAHYLWLPGADHFATKIKAEPEVAIALDCDGLDRLGDLRPAVESAPVLVSIDHHLNLEPFGDLRYVEARASATAQLVLRLLQGLQWPVTETIATCLYTGLATDTGFFRFENTGQLALADAAELAGLGASPSEIAALAAESRSVARTRLLGLALRTLQMDATGRIAWAVLSPRDFRETATGAGDTEGIVDALKQVQGQQAAVLLKAPERDDRWQVSLRSARGDVAAVARQFGGGGHARAAGCDVDGPLEEVAPRVIGAVAAALDAATSA